VPRVSQTVVDTQDTEKSDTPAFTLDGVGTVTCVHVVPFQASASAPAASPPTVRQNVGPTHDTLFSVSFALGATLTPGTTVHEVPFHRSMSVPPPVVVFCCPTATQKDAVVQETSFRRFDPDPDAAVALVQFEALTVGGEVSGVVPPDGRGPVTSPSPTTTALAPTAVSVRIVRRIPAS